MRSLILRSSVIVGLAQAAACGGSAPAPAATPTVTTEPVAIAIAAEPVRVAPVAEPADVIGVLQWKNPLAMVQTTAPSVNAALLQTGGEALAVGLFKETLGPSISAQELAKLVAIDAPVTGLVALHPNVKKRDVVAAYSVGLRSIDEAKQLAEPKQLTETSPGVWRIEESNCLLAALPAPMAARLVCSDTDKGLETLSPYMVRTMPFAAPSDADLHVELRVSPAEARYGDMARQLISQAPILAQAALEIDDRDLIQGLTEAISGVGDDFGLLMRDVNTIALDLNAAPTGVTSRGYLTFRSTNSWTAQTIVRSKDHAGAPPAIFWRLPKDSESAYYGVGDDPNRYTDIIRVLRRLVLGGLGELKFGSEADRRAVSDLIRAPFGANVISVSAKGGTHLDAQTPSPDASDIVGTLLSSWAGWTVMGSETDPQAMNKYLKDFVAAYNRPGIQAALKRDLMPLIKLVPTVKSVAAPTKLGAGAMGIEFKATIPAGRSKKAKAQTVAFVLYMMADGQRTWMAMGPSADKDELVKRLLSVKASAPTVDSLAAREGLERLKQSKLASGGFMTMAPVLNQLGQKSGALGGMAGKDELKAIQRAIQTLPNHGTTPIPLMVTASATETALSVEVPRAAINDVAHLLTSVITALAGSGGSATP